MVAVDVGGSEADDAAELVGGEVAVVDEPVDLPDAVAEESARVPGAEPVIDLWWCRFRVWRWFRGAIEIWMWS